MSEKKKVLISCAVTAQLICAFVFAHVDCLFSDVAAQLQTAGMLGDRHLSRLMGKPTICIGENKDADQLRGNREADQRLCFRYSDSTIPPLLNSKISSF